MVRLPVSVTIGELSARTGVAASALRFYADHLAAQLALAGQFHYVRA